MTMETIQRRGVLAGLGLAVAVPAIGSPPKPDLATSIPSFAALARRLTVINDQHAAIDASRPRSATADEDMLSLHVEETALENLVLTLTPRTVEDALIVLMVATNRLNIGRHCEGADDDLEKGEEAVRGATAVLSKLLGVRPPAYDQYLPLRLAPSYVGSA